jgi:hypothetical protein
MADQLLEQVRDAVEGQIVCGSLILTDYETNIRRTSRASDLRRCLVPCYLEQLVYVGLD